MLLVELDHNLDLDVMLILPLYRVTVGWGSLMKVQLTVQLFGAVVAMTHAVVLQWDDEMGSTVLPGIL